MDLAKGWSIEDVARTTDIDAVRRRYDQRNLLCVFILLLFFTIVSIIAAFSDREWQDLQELVFSNLSVVLVAVSLLLLRNVHRAWKAPEHRMWRPARWVRNHVSASVLTYIALQYVIALGLAHDDEKWVGWVMTFPLMMLGFRMLVSELVLLHVFLFSTGMALTLLAENKQDEMVKSLIAAGVINLLALGTELFASYRMRKSVVTEFTDRRAQAREQIRMRDELRYARELQLSMLPESAPKLEWVEVAGVSIPATEVGGDYYDYFVDVDRVALVCGDVAGHGMASGLVLSAIRSGFTLLRDSLTDPAAVLQRLHDLVAETSRRRMLVTVSVVLLDRAKHQATIASAGHPPVFHRRADGHVEAIDLFAPPLGVRLPVDIPQRRVAFSSGDVFVLHSDGIYEARNSNDEVYGLERLASLIAAHPATSAESLRDAIVDDVTHFRAGAEQGDDVTVVVCRITA